ncbi:hypothetical protein C8R45DRAFT_1221958 [Mycena sanguinolenta]|nr:hypothetical protein C8R45DRAFT_1221958 [Mycena sanguinolenta]
MSQVFESHLVCIVSLRTLRTEAPADTFLLRNVLRSTHHQHGAPLRHLRRPLRLRLPPHHVHLPHCQLPRLDPAAPRQLSLPRLRPCRALLHYVFHRRLTFARRVASKSASPNGNAQAPSALTPNRYLRLMSMALTDARQRRRHGKNMVCVHHLLRAPCLHLLGCCAFQFSRRGVPKTVYPGGDVALDVPRVVGGASRSRPLSIRKGRSTGASCGGGGGAEGNAQAGTNTTARKNDCWRGTASVRFLNPKMAFVDERHDGRRGHEQGHEHDVLEA